VRESKGDLSAAPRISLVRGLPALVWNLLVEGLAIAWFRIRPRAASLERARRAAWRGGRTFAMLRPGRDQSRTYGRIGRVTSIGRGIIARLAPEIE
jgi:hypothetical protein